MKQNRELSIPRMDESTVPMEAGAPFAGGWGYSRETACIITDDREPSEQETTGRDFEAIFIQRRLCAELVNAAHACGPLVNIRWNARSHDLHRNPDGTPAYDQFTVQVRAFLKSEYYQLLAEAAALEGDDMGRESRFAFREKMRTKELSYTTDCWFDVSCVKGITDDDEFTTQVYRGQFFAPGEEGARGDDMGGGSSAR